MNLLKRFTAWIRGLFTRTPALLPDIPFSDADARSALSPTPAQVAQAQARMRRRYGGPIYRAQGDALALVREYRRRVRALYSVRPRPWLSPNARAQALRERARAARGRA